MAVDSELKSIVALLDDTDQTVIEAVNRRLLERGEEVISDLKSMSDSLRLTHNEKYLSEKIDFLETEFTIEKLYELSQEEFPDLKTGFWLITKLLNPQMSLSHFDKSVQLITTAISEDINDEQTALEKTEILNHYFYEVFKYQCRDYPPDRESTTLLLSVLEGKKGGPIPIAILYFLFARCCAIDFYPLCFVGGFVPAYVSGDKVLFYVDLYKNGHIFYDEKLNLFFETQGIEFEDNVFEVREDRVLLVIYLESLYYMYSSCEGGLDRSTLIDRVLKMFGDERFLASENLEE